MREGGLDEATYELRSITRLSLDKEEESDGDRALGLVVKDGEKEFRWETRDWFIG